MTLLTWDEEKQDTRIAEPPPRACMWRLETSGDTTGTGRPVPEWMSCVATGPPRIASPLAELID